jgi:DNA-binding protein HU-beta
MVRSDGHPGPHPSPAGRALGRNSRNLKTGCNCHLSLTLTTQPFSISALREWETPVIKLDIVNEVVSKTGITKTKAEMAVETVFESMKRALSQGDRIELRGFGVFNVRPRKTGIGRNPRTGAEVNIPPGKAVRFKPGKELQSID